MRDLIKYGLFLIAALSLLTSNAVALSDPSDGSIKLENNYSSQAGIKPENNSCEPIDINICIDFILYNHEELIEYSDTIVIGTVKEILPSRWNTKDGKHPGKPTAELDYFDDTIYTDIVISVDEYLKTRYHPERLL
jgi:hypothetical protein